MFEKPPKFQTALIAGLVIGGVSGIPGISIINCCCCAGIVLGGVLAMYLYTKEFVPEMPPVEATDALVLGMLAGMVGAFSATIIESMIRLIFGNVGSEYVVQLVDQIVHRLEESGSLTSDMAEQLRRQVEESMEQPISFFSVMTSLFVSLFIYPIFAMLGALIGYSFFRPKQPVGTPPPPAA